MALLFVSETWVKTSIVKEALLSCFTSLVKFGSSELEVLRYCKMVYVF